MMRILRRTGRVEDGKAAGSTTAASIERRSEKWSMGMLNDRETDEVPGSVLLLPEVNQYNAPLGLEQIPARTSTSSLPALSPSRTNIFSRPLRALEKKKTADGKFILEPQPTDSANDPLNWPVLRRDLALISLGLYCMIGGGMTPVLAAGFNNVATDLNVTVPQVALTTGLYMMGLGLGSVVLSPTAILYGKRPVYLVAAICFVLANIWCALSPNFASLVVARIFMGFAVSSVECLPSASIAEIYFLHEKAYRLGIYTLLLLGGKNIVPLISAAIIQSLGWRWVFWILAIIVAFAGVLLFLFVPETFWDRSPKPRVRRRSVAHLGLKQPQRQISTTPVQLGAAEYGASTIAKNRVVNKHAHFRKHSDDTQDEKQKSLADTTSTLSGKENVDKHPDSIEPNVSHPHIMTGAIHHSDLAEQSEDIGPTEHQADVNKRGEQAIDRTIQTSRGLQIDDTQDSTTMASQPGYFDSADGEGDRTTTRQYSHDVEAFQDMQPSPGGNPYTKTLTTAAPRSFAQQLRPFSGRLTHDTWFKAAFRPFILFAYPSILWSALVYALSIGWLIVLSESVSSIYENRSSYNFTALQVGLVYISPFVGGILGTAVAGKVSDLIVRYLAAKNGGVYEPEFRLVMAIPITITTVIGLMGYGWSVAERDAWIVPTIFFGLISFGCSLGSTTSITFAVDSYRQYAGEALVTLNFSKNILHGLVWSLFFNKWLEADGSKTVFVAIGGIQLACLLTTIPMYIYGKRGRMWTVRMNLMEKF